MAAEEADVVGAYDAPPFEELVSALPVEDRRMATRAFENGEYLNIFRGSGLTVLVQAGDVRVHPDPAADRDFIEGRTTTPDPLKDQAYADYISGKLVPESVVGPQVGGDSL